MKKLWAATVLLLALVIPVLAQGQRLSPEDQQRFDSYYSRWEQYRQTNNRDQMSSMEKRMQDIYAHYGIPPNTPYSRVASNGGGYRDRDRDRAYDQDRDHDRDRDRDAYRNQGWNRGRAQLSPDDQQRFDSYYSRWLQYRQTNNRDQVQSMQKRMWDVYDHYGIPHNVPFDAVSSQGRRY